MDELDELRRRLGWPPDAMPFILPVDKRPREHTHDFVVREDLLSNSFVKRRSWYSKLESLGVAICICGSALLNLYPRGMLTKEEQKYAFSAGFALAFEALMQWDEVGAH